MESTFLLACIAALVLPSLQFDDGKLSFQGSRLARAFDNTRRAGAKIRGNLEIVGPRGGVFEANVDGALGRLGNLFKGETRGHLRGGVRRRGPFGGVSGTSGSVKGAIKRGPGLMGADLAGRIDHVAGNVFSGVRRHGAKGRVSAGAAVSGFSPFDNSYTAGLVGQAIGRPLGLDLHSGCGVVPRRCRAVSPRQRGATLLYTYDGGLNRCVSEYVTFSCAQLGRTNNLFSSIGECRSVCNCD